MARPEKPLVKLKVPESETPASIKGPNQPDAIIRESGFMIFSRPKTGPAVWSRGRHTYVQLEALEIAQREQQKAMQAAKQSDI